VKGWASELTNDQGEKKKERDPMTNSKQGPIRMWSKIPYRKNVKGMVKGVYRKNENGCCAKKWSSSLEKVPGNV